MGNSPRSDLKTCPAERDDIDEMCLRRPRPHGCAQFPWGISSTGSAAIHLSAAGLDDWREPWIAADACTAGRMQQSCFGIVDAETSFRGATRTWPD
jgi:hypothetical protein